MKYRLYLVDLVHSMRREDCKIWGTHHALDIYCLGKSTRLELGYYTPTLFSAVSLYVAMAVCMCVTSQNVEEIRNGNFLSKTIFLKLPFLFYTFFLTELAPRPIHSISCGVRLSVRVWFCPPCSIIRWFKNWFKKENSSLAIKCNLIQLAQKKSKIVCIN